MNQKGILRRMLLSCSSLNDIKTYCFELDIDYEQLGNLENKNDKAIELINYVCQRRMQGKFRDYLMGTRPEIFWGEVDWAKLCANEGDSIFLDNGRVTVEFPGNLEEIDIEIVREKLARAFKVDTQEITIISARAGSVIVDAIIPVYGTGRLVVGITRIFRHYLRRGRITSIDHSFANLEGANLIGANLEGANLEGANLEGANLTKANLYSANLYSANLAGVDLMSADLGNVNLTGANLIEAKLDSDFDVSTVSYDENTVWPWDEDRESEKVKG